MFSLYDSKLRAVTAIRPAGRGQLRMYSCGPVLESPAHLGDLRPAVLADLISRNGQRSGLSVITCQSLTEAGQSGSQQDALRADCLALNVGPPDYAPRTSESIGLVIDLIATLIAAGHAYVAGIGTVCFDAASFPGYGELPGSNPRQDAPVPGDGRRSPADWPLWISDETGPGFDAPWGAGFPARHAECSAASINCLGTVDLHVGPLDLLSEHEQERAQSDAAAGREVVRHWIHVAGVLFDGTDMTGPGANAVRLADLAEHGLDPLAVRLAFLEHSYRAPAYLSWSSLTSAGAELRTLREFVADCATEPSKPMCAGYSARIFGALDNDMDTPGALAALRELASDPDVPAGSKFETFAATDRILGLDLVSLVGQPRSSSR